MRIHGLHQAERRDRRVEIGVPRMAKCMDTGIGAAGAMDDWFDADDLSQRFLDMLLHGRAIGLPLPAHIRPAVIFHSEGETGRGTVPAGMGKPRSSSHGHGTLAGPLNQ